MMVTAEMCFGAARRVKGAFKMLPLTFVTAYNKLALHCCGCYITNTQVEFTICDGGLSGVCGNWSGVGHIVSWSRSGCRSWDQKADGSRVDHVSLGVQVANQVSW